MFKCKICGFEGKNLISISKHISVSHKISTDNYYLKYISETKVIPTCKCGCGEQCKFVNIERGFTEYKIGHISRVHNNWGNNKRAQIKSAATRREQYKNGEREVWNKGLDITDPRVKAYAEKSTKEANPERAKKISKTQKQQFKDGIRSNEGENNPMFGKHHSTVAKDKMRLTALKNMKYRGRLETSSLEIEISMLLSELNIQHEFQFPAYDINSFFDFKIKDKKILIEVDGDYWHCNPNTKFKDPKYAAQIANLKGDKIKNEWALKNGYKLLRFWESDIKNNRLQVVENLINAIKN